MPNRILKESICTSDNLNELTEESENFFYRLLVCCDDFGRFDGRPAIIKSRCYPLKNKTVEQIVSYLGMLQAKKIIKLYQVEGKIYIQMRTWDNHQQVRAKKSKFPAPDDNSPEMDINCYQMQSNVSVIQSNPIQSESNTEPQPIPFEDIRMSFNKFCGSLPNATIVTPERRDLIKVLWRRYETHEGGAIAFFDTLFKKTEQSDFLTGRGGNKRWCSFEWIMKEDHPVKIVEGQYDNCAMIDKPSSGKADIFDVLKGAR